MPRRSLKHLMHLAKTHPIARLARHHLQRIDRYYQLPRHAVERVPKQIPLNLPQRRQRMPKIRQPMQRPDRLRSRTSDRERLHPPRETRILMRLHQTHRHTPIRLHQRPVQPHRQHLLTPLHQPDISPDTDVLPPIMRVMLHQHRPKTIA